MLEHGGFILTGSALAPVGEVSIASARANEGPYWVIEIGDIARIFKWCGVEHRSRHGAESWQRVGAGGGGMISHGHEGRRYEENESTNW